MRGAAEYLASCVVIMALISAVCALFVRGSTERTVVMSGAIAVAVQLVAFVVARTLRARHLLLGWGLGSALRVVALVVYSLVVANLLHAPLAPALLSFAAFLFVTTVVEPVFLNR